MEEQIENTAYQVVCTMIDLGLVDSEPDGIELEYSLAEFLKEHLLPKGWRDEVEKQKKTFTTVFGFKLKTCFLEEFNLADFFGSDNIRHHYNRIFEQCKDNLECLTELVLVLNWKTSQWYGVDDTIGLTYDELWHKTDAYAMKTLKGDDLHYYLSTLD